MTGLCTKTAKSINWKMAKGSDTKTLVHKVFAAAGAGGEAARTPTANRSRREKGGEGARKPEKRAAACPPCPTKGRGETD